MNTTGQNINDAASINDVEKKLPCAFILQVFIEFTEHGVKINIFCLYSICKYYIIMLIIILYR